MSEQRIEAIIDEALGAVRSVKTKNVKDIWSAACAITHALRNDHRVYIMGNGGSAADAQHMATELVGRFRIDRKALPVMSFTTDTSVLTSLSNDYGFQAVFSKQVEGFVRKGDVVICISTSGNSPNVVGALMVARELGAVVIGLTGRDGGKMSTLCDHLIAVGADSTARIQEGHAVIIHVLCELVESDIFGQV